MTIRLTRKIVLKIRLKIYRNFWVFLPSLKILLLSYFLTSFVSTTSLILLLTVAGTDDPATMGN